eukprot:122923_1
MDNILKEFGHKVTDPMKFAQEEEMKEKVKEYYELKCKSIVKREYKSNGYNDDIGSTGIIAAIGTEFTSNENDITKWKNPSIKHNDRIQKIIVKSCPNIDEDSTSLTDITGLIGTECFLDSKETKNACVSIDFVSLCVRPSHYTLRHGYWGEGSNLSNWNFEGSNDGVTWKCLDNKENNNDLRKE